jgi:organic radical activating enzyme
MRVPGIKHVVITGGEPTIQMGELEELATKLRELGRHITLETNGVIKPNIDLFDLVMVSPKSIATAEEWFVEAISRKNVEYKFVIGPKEIELVLDWIRSKGLIGVYLMPMGADIDSVINGSQVIMAAMIDKHLDCIICPRIHVLMGVK